MRFSRLVLALPLFFSACAHGPKPIEATPYRSQEGMRELLRLACEPGTNVESVKGSVWLKAKSRDASGQFPAAVEATSQTLRMEVTNLLGGTEAIVSVDGTRYQVEVPGKKDRGQRGENSWSGIPLVWANALFLGRIPCPDEMGMTDAKLKLLSEDPLTLEARTTARLDRLAEVFRYTFKAVDGKPWAETLHWERQSVLGAEGVVVDFNFEDSEEKTRSPLKWDARGPQGEIRTRWKDRQPKFR